MSTKKQGFFIILSIISFIGVFLLICLLIMPDRLLQYFNENFLINNQTYFSESMRAECRHIEYTTDEIHIISFECGYRTGENNPGLDILVMDTAEQVAYAKERYGLGTPTKEYPNHEIQVYQDIIDTFAALESEYPIDQYSYVYQYVQTASGGYYLNVDKLVVDGTRLYFGYTEDSQTPDSFSEYPCVMGGYIHMAAIPKDLLSDFTLDNVIYPDANDFTQDLNYRRCIYMNACDENLYNHLQDGPYFIQTEAEFDEFLELTGGNEFFQNMQTSAHIDFDYVSIYLDFYLLEYDNQDIRAISLDIVDGTPNFQFEIQESSTKRVAFDTPQINVVYVAIPKSYL